MDAHRQFAAANVLIGVGIAVFALWALFSYSVAQRGAGLTDLFLLGGTGVVAYVTAMLVAGAGFLWADRVVHTSHVQAPRLTRNLVKLLVVVLLAPWVLFLGSIAVRSVR